MTKARHRLAHTRRDDIAKHKISWDGSVIGPDGDWVEVISTIYIHPVEDTTLYDVRGGITWLWPSDPSMEGYIDTGSLAGGTGSTSASFNIDQHCHHGLAGASSNALVCGSARWGDIVQANFPRWHYWFQFPEENPPINLPDGGDGTSGAFGWLETPARRMAMHFDCNLANVGGISTDGITTGDEIIEAEMSLNVLRARGSEIADAAFNDPPIFTNRTVNVYRLSRGDGISQGASHGISQGSFNDMSWFSYKGGACGADAVPFYWGSKGGDSGEDGGGTALSQDIDTSVFRTRSDGVTLDHSFTQPAQFTWDDYWYPDEPLKISFDVKSLVQDAIDSRTGDLNLMFIGEKDTDKKMESGPGGGADYFVNWCNEYTYYSTDSEEETFHLRPIVKVTFKRLLFVES